MSKLLNTNKPAEQVLNDLLRYLLESNTEETILLIEYIQICFFGDFF